MVMAPIDLEKRLARIKLLATDVDGVLTDGGMYYSERGDELKKFNTRDGKGIELLRRTGVKVAFITSEDTLLVKRRAEKLKVDFVIQGAKGKAAVLRELAGKCGIAIEETAYVGDDINDVEALKLVGFSATVADGMPDNKETCHYVTKAKGGEGAVREIAALIISAKSGELSVALAVGKERKMRQ
jgi:3-deoxy-D-manno-octulosonate 8-phosphate phosphatase (KDO 8-P phosphatase)